MTDWLRLPDLARVAQSTWLELGLYPRTLVHAYLIPKVLAARLPRQLRDSAKSTYTGPILFFAVNAVLASWVARLMAVHTVGTLLAALPSVLLGAITGNAVLLGLAVAFLGRVRRRDHELMLVTLAYGSAYYVPLSAVLARVINGASGSPGSQPAGALLLHDSWLSVLRYLALDSALELSLAVVLSLAWLLFLARVTSATRSRRVPVGMAFARLAGALVLLVTIEMIVQYAAVAGPYGEMRRFGSAYQRLVTTGMDVHDVGSYEAAETLARNITGCSAFPPAERYMARAFASTMVVARFEVAEGLAARFGEARGPELQASPRDLLIRVQAPARFEAALEETATAWLGSASGSLVSIERSLGGQLGGDLRELRLLRSNPGFPRSDVEFREQASQFRLGMWVVPTGLYLCPVPQATSWPPSCRYALHVGYDLSVPRRSAVSYVWVEENPMKHMLFLDNTVKH